MCRYVGVILIVCIVFLFRFRVCCLMGIFELSSGFVRLMIVYSILMVLLGCFDVSVSKMLGVGSTICLLKIWICCIVFNL